MNAGQFLSFLEAFRNIKTRRHSEIKKTRSRTKQDFSKEALSKQNTEAQLASLSYSSFQATTEWSTIFAKGVYVKARQDIEFYNQEKVQLGKTNITAEIYLPNHISTLHS